MLLRVVVSEGDREPLPAVDVDGDFAIGDGADARVRLPAAALRGRRVVVRASEVGDGQTFELGGYHVHVAPAPPGATPTPPQRTESLARELVRNLLGASAAPTLTIERGVNAGVSRTLAPPESVLVIGREDEAGWVLDDDQLSRLHAEVRRGWDGVRVLDLGSKNGTRVDGVRLTEGEGVELKDGGLIELGGVAIRLRDPAEAALGPSHPSPSPRPRPVAQPRNVVAFWLAIAVLFLAVAGLVWLAAVA